MKDRLGLFALLAGMFALPAVSGYEITGIPVFGLLEDFAQNPLGNVLLVKLLYIAIIATMLRWLFKIIFFHGKEGESGEKYATTIAVLMGVMAGVFTPVEAMASLMGFVGSWVGLLILGVAIYFIIYLAVEAGRRLGEFPLPSALRWIIGILLILLFINFIGAIVSIATNEWLQGHFAQLIDWIATFAVFAIAVGVVWGIMRPVRRAAPRVARSLGGAARAIGSGARDRYDRVRQAQRNRGAPTPAQHAHEQAQQNHTQHQAERAQQHERRGERDERRARSVERQEEQVTQEAVGEEEQVRKDMRMLSMLLSKIANVTASVQAWNTQTEERQKVHRYVARFQRFLAPIKRDAKRLRHTFRQLKRLDAQEHRFLAKGNREFTWLRKDLEQDPQLRDEQVEEIVQRVYKRHKQLRNRYKRIRGAIERGVHEEEMIDKELRSAFKQLGSLEDLWTALMRAHEGGTLSEDRLRNIHALSSELAQKIHLIEEKLVVLEQITEELERYEKDEDVLLMRELQRARGSRQELNAVLQRYSG